MFSRNLKFTLILTLHMYLCTGLEEKYKLLGKRCTNTTACYINEHDDKSMTCVHGRCQCNTPNYILFLGSSLSGPHAGEVIGCKDVLTTKLKVLEGFHVVCQDSSRGKLCRCEDGMELFSSKLLPNGACSHASRVGFQEYCRYSSYCNYEDGLRCNGRKCVCDREDMYNFNKTECVSRADYMKSNNISEYKVTHGVYCESTADCIEGLTCNSRNLSCSCPAECPYLEKNQSCDCGEIVYKTPAGPIIVGVIIGFLIIVCWCKTTNGTIKRHFKKKDLTDEHEVEHLNTQPEDATHLPANALPYDVVPADHNANNPEQSTTVPYGVPTPAYNPGYPEPSTTASDYMPTPAFNPDYLEGSVKAPDTRGSHKDLPNITALPKGPLVGFDLSSGPTALGNNPQPYLTNPSAPTFPAFSASTPSLPYSLSPQNPPTCPIPTTEAPNIPMEGLFLFGKPPPSYDEAMSVKKNSL